MGGPQRYVGSWERSIYIEMGIKFILVYVKLCFEMQENYYVFFFFYQRL